MKIIICGAGRNGLSIARYLAEEKNDITVIDTNRDLLEQLANNLDVKTVHGYASHPDVLKKANADKSDMIIALTDSDEINMIACQVAYTKFNIPSRIAKIKQEAYLDKDFQKEFYTKNNMPVGAIISPEKEIVNSIISRLNLPEAFDNIKLSNSKVGVVCVLCKDDCPILDMPLKRLSEQFPKIRMQVIAIIREQKVIFPKGDDVLKSGDEVYFCIDYKHVKKGMEAFGYKNVKNHRTLIVGGGRVGFELAKEIEKNSRRNFISAKIIEQKNEQAELLANSFKKVKVINGDGKNIEILKEVNIKAFDSIISLTDSDESNILISLLGKKQGVDRSIALINNSLYDSVAKEIGVDSIVTPHSIVSSRVLEYTKTSKIKSVHSIRDNCAEIIEAKAKSGSKIVSDKIANLNLPDSMRIGAIVKNKSKDNVVIPNGQDKVAVGDTVILIADPETVSELEKLFE